MELSSRQGAQGKQSPLEYVTLFTCATLEPPALPLKGGGGAKGPIPPGTYLVKWQWSNHYHCLMPFLQNVPGFTGIMIHTGNTSKDTRGCILVGETSYIRDGRGFLQSSTPASRKLELLLKESPDPVHITIM